MLFALLFLFFALLINFVSLFVCFPQYFHLIFVNFFISQPVFGNFPRQIARERGLQLDSASLHLAHGLRPPQFKTSGSSLAARFRFAPISLTGCARLSSRRPAQALQLDSASLHLAHGLRPIQEKRRSHLFVQARQMASPFFLCMA